MNFERAINRAILITEAVVDIPRDTLDPQVFQFFDGEGTPILRDGIKAQILQDIQALASVVPVVNFYITGDILTHDWTPKTSIDVNVETDPEAIDSISVAEVLFNLRRLNGRLAIGTQHPINYYIIPDDVDYDSLDAVYDIANERWARLPEILNPGITSFMSRITETISSIDITTGKIHRNLINFEELKNIGFDNLKQIRHELQRKIDQLGDSIHYLTTIYSSVDALRRLATDQTTTVEEILYYSEKEYLPENVTFKLLEKYYYTKITKKIDQLLDVDKEYDINQTIKQSKMGADFLEA